MQTNLKQLSAIFAVVFLLVSCHSSPEVKWEKFTEENLEVMLASGKPTLVYFYAAWCGPCRDLKYSTFRDANVVSQIEKWNRLKADMSFRENAKTIERSQTFEVWGLPMFNFYDASGKLVFRKTGFISAAELIEIFESVEAKT